MIRLTWPADIVRNGWTARFKVPTKGGSDVAADRGHSIPSAFPLILLPEARKSFLNIFHNMPRSALRRAAFLAMAMQLLFYVSPTALGQSNSDCPALPGDQQNWKEQEQWVWKTVCEGRAANLQAHYGGSADPASAGDWPPQRDLTSAFLRTIVLREPYRSSNQGQGVTIVGARFRETVNLQKAALSQDLILSGSRFERALNMREMRAGGNVAVRSGYFLDRGDAVDLAGAQIGGTLDLSGDRVPTEPAPQCEPLRNAYHFNMDGLLVEKDLVMRSVALGSVWLANAKVGGGLSINDSSVRGELRMIEVTVGRDLYMLNSTLTCVKLRSAKIHGDLAIEGPSRRAGPCGLRTTPRPPWDPQSVDLTAATVGGTLSFGSACYGPFEALLNWGAGAHLSLRNASVNTLQDGIECQDPETDCPNTWPDHLELDGFAYRQFGHSDAGVNTDMAARPARWSSSWLGRQARYSPEPYERLAGFLAKRGYKDKANDVLYRSKALERAQTRYPRKLWLWLEGALIGYGYRTYYALGWVVGFILLGAAVLRLSGEGPRNHLPYGIAFSIDMLLPIIRLRDLHYDIDLHGWPRYYFYFHKMMGYVLASFLIAGLSGLTR